MDRHDDRIAEFHRLHACGVLRDAEPVGRRERTALEQLGFPALATTSAGLAWTLGRPDDQVTRDQTLEHLRQIAGAVAVPVNADFKDGFAVDPAGVAANVTLAAATGIAGLSIEDSSGDEDRSAARLRARRGAGGRRPPAIDESGTGIVLTGRSEGFVCGRPDIDETIRRLRAYAEAGADCLYAPRIDQARARVRDRGRGVTETGEPPDQSPFTTVAEAAQLGVRRISVGGTLARTAWDGFLKAAREIAEAGTFSRFERLPDVEALLGGLTGALH